jgi:predicted ArsR family transcriptional regulator
MENLGPSPARFDPSQSPLSASRARVLEALQQASGPESVADVAVRLGLHENTARKHLDDLARRGLVSRTARESSGRGRPGWMFEAYARSGEPDARVRDYVGLATALAHQIAATSDDPRRDAISAGERWGAALATEFNPGSAPDQPRDAPGAVVALLRRLGFAPDVAASGTSVALRRCPLLDAVRAEPGVVCAVHAGIARGVYKERGEDPDGVQLLPFAEPGACRLLLATGLHTR